MLRRVALVVIVWLCYMPCAHAADILSLRTIHAFQKGEASSIFDPVRRRILVVGGVGAEGPGPVAALDLNGFPTWSWPAVEGTPPPPGLRWNPAVYDPVRDRMIILAGTTMWSLNLASPMSWSQVQPAGTAPTSLPGASLVYDSKRDRLIGFSRAGANSATWTLSLDASPQWAELPTAGGVPPYREKAAACFDADQDRMIVTCGMTATGPSNDSWNLTFAGGIPTWNPLVTQGGTPTPRYEPASAYDPASKSLYLFGGINGSALTGTYRLDLNADNWGNLWTGPEPTKRGGAIAGWDSAGARLVLTGGYDPGASTSDQAKGNLYQWAGSWTELDNSGGYFGSPAFVSFDAGGRRFAAEVSDRPMFLSMQDSTWTAAGPAYHAKAPLGRFYEPATNLYCSYGPDTIATIHPGPGATWTRIATTGTKPQFRTNGPTFLSGNRLIIVGGKTYGLSSSYYTDDIYALDYATGVWSILPSSNPLGVRIMPVTRDTRRNRFLFFGGATTSINGLVYVAHNDLWSFDPSTLQWRQMSPGGTIPTPRYDFTTAYDSARDRVIVFGGAKNGPSPGDKIPAEGVYYLDFAGGGDGTWKRYDPAGEKIPSRLFDDAGYDGTADHFYSPIATGFYDLGFANNEPRYVLTMPPPTVWQPGSIHNVNVHLKQNHKTPLNYSWSVTSQRNWPGFPLLGSVALADTTMLAIPIGIPVPDSASIGTDTLMFAISDGTVALSSNFVFGDVASPVPWALFDSHAEFGRVRLAWWTSNPSAGVAEVQRRSASSVWEPLGSYPVSGDGFVRFEDETVGPGARYAYRVGAAGVFSEESWIDVPVAALAFARKSLVVHGSLEVAFTLPGAGPARLEAFDLAGRRVASREVTGEGAHAVELGGLRSGVYFLRLVQNGAKVTARAVVVGGP